MKNHTGTGADMRFIETFNSADFLDSIVSLTIAFLLGSLIGAERQFRQRTAGLRTYVLVAVGSAAFTDLAMRFSGSSDAMRVVSNVVTGVGFLGAGVIMKEGLNVRGLNTAATLWCSAAVGACAGVDMPAEAVLVTFIVIVGNTLLRPIASAIDRIPISAGSSEVSYELRVTIEPTAPLAEIRDRVIEALEAAKYPVSDVVTETEPDGAIDIIAKLVATAVNAKELESVAAKLEKAEGVRYATWESSTQE